MSMFSTFSVQPLIMTWGQGERSTVFLYYSDLCDTLWSYGQSMGCPRSVFLTQTIWSLPLWKFSTKAFQARQKWNLTSESQPQWGASEEEQRKNVHKWKWSSLFYLHITGTMKEIKSKTWLGLREVAEWSPPTWTSMSWPLSPSSGGAWC